MNEVAVLRRCVGDMVRFGDFRDRVELLCDGQIRTWSPDSGAWIVVPLDRQPLGFYLVSLDREGQRRGREVLTAFLGPTANLETITLAPRIQPIDRDLQSAGFTHLAYVERTEGMSAERLLSCLEDVVATAKGKEVSSRAIRPSHVHLLRDFRLGLQLRDPKIAEQALDDLALTGQLSAENIRFLTIEMLGSLGRWFELRDLPYLGELLRARRPKAVNELILEMLWHTELSERQSVGEDALTIYEKAALGPRYGAALQAVDVPTRLAAWRVATIVALAKSDTAHLDRLASAAPDDAERTRLQNLVGRTPPPDSTRTADKRDAKSLFEEGRYDEIIQFFVESPSPDLTDVAIQSVLERHDLTHAAAVLTAARRFVDDGSVQAHRHLIGDLKELAGLVEGRCNSWTEWAARLERDEPWPDGAQVLRSSHTEWTGLAALSSVEATAVSDHVLQAWTGINGPQIVIALDLLCKEASRAIDKVDVCDMVLLILADQENIGESVRGAYLELFDEILANGPTAARYASTLDHALGLWKLIASSKSADWAIGLIDTVLAAPASDAGAQIDFVSTIVVTLRTIDRRLSFRQRTEIEILAKEAGLASQKVPAPETGVDIVWHRLDGTTIAVYSLLPHAAEMLESRLRSLCSPKAIVGNADKVSTSALLSLAKSANHFIVDTHHAAHAATGAINSVRPSERQIFPIGRGVSAFVRALEDALVAETN